MERNHKNSPVKEQGKVKNFNGNNDFADKLEVVQYYVTEYVKNGHKADEHESWINLAFEFASLGEEGRKPFHQVSSTSSKYDFDVADNKFTQISENHNGDRNIESFFHHCTHDLSIDPFQSNGKKRGGISSQPKRYIEEEEKWCFNLEDILNAPPLDRIWHFFIKCSVNAIVASSDIGKSTLIRNLSYAVISGEETFLGWKLNCPKRQVIIVSTEDGLSAAREGLEPLIEKENVIGDIRLLLDAYKLTERLEEILEEKPADLVFIDTWGDTISGRYDSDKTRVLMQEIRKISRKYDATPVFVHHTNKAGENIPDKSQIKGAGDFEQAARSVTMMVNYKGSRWLALVKGNNFDSEEKKICYRLDFDPVKKQLHRSNETMPRDEMIMELRNESYTVRKTEIDWAGIFDKGEIRRVDIINNIVSEAGLGESGARERMNKMIDKGNIIKLENGIYKLSDKYSSTET